MNATEQNSTHTAIIGGHVLVKASDIQFCIDAIAHLKGHKARIRLESLLDGGAAPDLLHELVGLVGWLEDNQRSIDGEFSMDDLLTGPRAAIAKAAQS